MAMRWTTELFLQKPLVKMNEFPNHVWYVSPGKLKSAIHVSCFVGNIFIKFGESGGGRQVEGQPLIDRLCTGDVLNYTQHSGLLRCMLDLQIKDGKKKKTLA